MTSNRRGFSLPITWILIAICIVVSLVFQYGWWWLGILFAALFAVFIAIVVIGGRIDAARKSSNMENDSEKEKLLQTLRTVLYGLYHIRHIEQSSTGGYLYDIVPEFTEQYSPEEQERAKQEIRKNRSPALKSYRCGKKLIN